MTSVTGAIRNYVLVTIAYWAFTLTDGALRMLVLLHFHELGYTPVQLAFLFLFYEFFGIVTNLFGGVLAARRGFWATLIGGLLLQVLALCMLALVSETWGRGAAVAYVMGAQALSGIAKDLTKMSAKSTIKVLVPEQADSALFRWVSLLTGSKNALKGAGFFLGGILLSSLGYVTALFSMAAALLMVLLLSAWSLPRELGKARAKSKFRGWFSKSRDINVLSAARLFLFGSRDIWFVVGVPVFLTTRLGYTFTQVGTLLALWVVGYGAVQATTPVLIGRFTHGRAPGGRAARVLSILLFGNIAALALAMSLDLSASLILLMGLFGFGAVFALNSSVHSYLILAYSDGDEVAMNVGFYYMANAGGRLSGTLLSGIAFQYAGVSGCLWASAAFAAATALFSTFLPLKSSPLPLSELKTDGGGD